MITSRKQLQRSATLLLSSALLSISPALAANPKVVTGAQLFRDKGCTYCHGNNAQGTDRGPSLLEVRKKLKEPQIEHQIMNGGQKMPRFGETLSKDEVAELVAFLRAKHRPNIPATETPASPAAQ